MVNVGTTFFDGSLIDSHEGQLSEWIVNNFERHSNKCGTWIRLELDLLFFVLRITPENITIKRTWQVSDDRIKHWLNAFILECGTHVDGGRTTKHGIASDRVDQFFGNFLFTEQHFHHLIAVHRQRFEHLAAFFFRFVLKLRRNWPFNNFFTFFTSVCQANHFNQVNDAFEVILCTDWDLHQKRISTKFVTQLLNHAIGVGTGAVHLVDEGKARHLVTFHLPVHRDGLTLHATDAAKHKHCTIEDTQTAFHLNREVHVTGCIDQVDRMVFIRNACGGTGNGDTAFTLEFHVVHGGTVTITPNLFDLVNPSGVKKDTLAQGCFP